MSIDLDLDNKCIKIDGVLYHLLDDRLVTYLKHSQPQSEVITTENLVDYVNKNSEPSEVSNGDGLDYEVVEYISDAGIIMATGKNDMRIKSVRRLSDGEIFSVGDNVCVDSNFDWKIESFTISRPNRISIGERLGAPIELNRINHWSNKKPSTTNEQKEEHRCKYCGVMTDQPDEECYKAPKSIFDKERLDKQLLKANELRGQLHDFQQWFCLNFNGTEKYAYEWVDKYLEKKTFDNLKS